MLPALVALEDFDARLPGGIPAGEEARAEATLNDASALVRAEAGNTWVDDAGALTAVPDVIVMVTVSAARRAFVNPDMLASESVVNYSATFSSASPDVYLTANEKKLIGKAVGQSGLWTLGTTRSENCLSDIPEEYDPYAEGWVE